jgi:hypothetical protein
MLTDGPLARAPLKTIPGASVIIRVQLLSDRVHAITEDSSGQIACIHILSGATENLAAGSWEEAVSTVYQGFI